MKLELDQTLVEKYPLLYRDRQGSPRDTSMCWGFACGDGWYSILDELSAKLEAEIVRLRDAGMPGDHLPRASQVKQKFGRLELYIRWGKETLYDGHEVFRTSINEAREKSLKTCEKCGAPGRLRDERVYVLTLCDECDTKR
jgi:formylmethanofuran dehydrogenase subunit E